MDAAVLALRELARYLKVHPNTVYRLAQRGLIPAFKVGSDWRFNRESIDRWRLEQEQAFAQQIASQHAASRPLAEEIFHVVYWYHAERLSELVAATDLGLFVNHTATAITRALNQLVRAGLLAKQAGREGRYCLTPQGLAQARQIFGSPRAAIAGHASVVEFALQRHKGDAATFEEKSFRPASRTEVRN